MARSQSGLRLYVGNLPYVAQKSDVEALFAWNGIHIKNIDISIDPFDGRNPSYCFVDFFNEGDAARAMREMQDQEVRGRPVRIKPNTRRRRPPESLQITKAWEGNWRRPPTTHRADGPTTVFDRWNRDDAEAHWMAPMEEKRRLWVGGLPRVHDRAIQAEMRDLFRDFKIQAISKLISPHPPSKPVPGEHYFCFVDVSSAAEAQSAVQALNGLHTPYGGLYSIRVSQYRSDGRATRVEREQCGITSRVQHGVLPVCLTNTAVQG